LWIGEDGEVRDFYQGILQIAVALHHWRNGNYGGSISLLESGVKLLAHVSDSCLWVDVAALITDSNIMRAALVKLGKEGMELLDPASIPHVKTVTA
jgi:hypothetical protein